jgi:hypothetical protein
LNVCGNLFEFFHAEFYRERPCKENDFRRSFFAHSPNPSSWHLTFLGSAGDLWNTQDTTDTTAISLKKNDGTLTSAVWPLAGWRGTATPNINGTYADYWDVSTAIRPQALAA